MHIPSVEGLFSGRGASPLNPAQSAFSNRLLSQDLSHHFPVDVGEAVIAAAISVSELFVIEAHEMEDGRVQVVDVALVLHGLPAEVVSGAEGHAAADATAGEPHGKSERM